MTFNIKALPLVLGLCLVSGTALAQQAEETAKPVVVPAPPAGQAEIVFYRMPGFAGSAISCAIHEKGEKIASLPPGRFFVLVSDPGTHTFTTASSGDEHGIYFDLKPGDIKYVGCTIVKGFWAGKADLEIPIRDDAFGTKLWKNVTPDRIVSHNVLTAAQLAAAVAATPAPAQPTSAGAPMPAATTSVPSAATTSSQ